MKTGTKKNKSGNSRNAILFVVAICLLVVMYRLGEFVVTRIPPYREGQCFHIKSDNPSYGAIEFKVIKNHLVAGDSDLRASLGAVHADSTVDFQEIRNVETEKMECSYE
jgi:hypothetical protein